MASLDRTLRRNLENTVKQARRVAEAGARKALEQLAVHHHEPWSSMPPDLRDLRNRLRAHGRQLGDQRDERRGTQTIHRLAGECAYEHWHRMLFARFLAENDLLIEPETGVAITLAECQELAREQALDWLELASSFAVRMLPQIFRSDDPVLQVSLPPESRSELEDLLKTLPRETFLADDSLGWVYQFWQAEEKDAINKSEKKIGADELPAVTQLFTEDYMVEFLLHNTLGAWWAGKRLTEGDAENTENEEELRRKVSLPGVEWEYLRFVRGADGKGGPWRPAAGTFDGWPKTAAKLKLLDPCCGSGHFMVAGLHHLVPIRMAEEGLSAREAVGAVLRDNLHGLEIDERCCQIAAFALAFAAWTYPSAGGYRPLPDLHIACSGLAPQCSAEEWIELAQKSGIPIPAVGREPIKNGLLNLHQLFSQAPTLGSLINPGKLPSDMIAADYETIQPYLAAVLKAEKADEQTRERAVAAAGMVKAADLLVGEYTLVITNVPYLGQNRQNDFLRDHLAKHYPSGKPDLATAFVLRCLEICSANATTAVVTPQNWLFLTTYAKLRKLLLEQRTLNVMVKLGENAFESAAAAGAFAAMLVLSVIPPEKSTSFSGIDVSAPRGQRPILAEEKAAMLRGDVVRRIAVVLQADQLKNPDSRIGLSRPSDLPILREYAESFWGLGSGDGERFCNRFWEISERSQEWEFLQVTFAPGGVAVGKQQVVFWQQGRGRLYQLAEESKEKLKNIWRRGHEAWGKPGVAVSQMGGLHATLYHGEIFQNGVAAIIPMSPENLPAIWTFCSSPRFISEVRKLDQKLSVTNATLVKVPFDVAYWQKVAAEEYPNGLPEPESDDPTQWLFHGRPERSVAPLQVAVARLLGYRWPTELDDKMRLSNRAQALVRRCKELFPFADADGIVCLSSIAREQRASGRLRALLATAFGPEWSLAKERQLLAATGSKKTSLEDWLLDEFFEQHCALFHHRPFVWHIWDGRRDGFNALVNYHKLAAPKGEGHRTLEKLIYTYLGDWITQQRRDQQAGVEGADARVASAVHLQEELKKILAGEPPYDIFVRWKPLHQQPIGWAPDINDGVRLNIRPFITARPLGAKSKTACILRATPKNIKWEKDRGKEPTRPKEDFPWFWGWDEKTENWGWRYEKKAPGKEEKPPEWIGVGIFDGNRWNDLHYMNKVKQAARAVAGKGTP
jgi:hypothetical protein